MAKRKEIIKRGPNGRPSVYTEELATTICTRIACGESLRSICRDDAIPHIATVMRWVFLHPEFREHYRLAREMQAEGMADEMQDIADNGSNDWMEKHDADGNFTGWRENGEAMRRSQLRIETRKWIAARLLPKRWGDKQVTEISGPDGAPLIQQSIDPRTLTPEAREALKIALRAAINRDATDATFKEED